MRTTISPPVFIPSVVILFTVLALAVVFPEVCESVLPALYDGVTVHFGWLYVLSAAVIFGFTIWLIASRHGDLRLGADDEEPAYSDLAWFSMLFSAGIGIGLIFYGVAEPILHAVQPPIGVSGSAAAMDQALPLTYHHWGILPWSIYAVVALSIAYFAYRRGLPIAFRSCFHPILGDRIHGWPGHVVDVLAVLGTLFGLATSLGLGAMSVSAGFHRVFGIADTTGTQLILIALVTLAAIVSLVSGVDKGIKRLSEGNMILAGCLLLFVFIAGPTIDILNTLVQSTGLYLSSFVERAFRTGVSNQGQEGKWILDWTVFYWGWWLSWAPFVGMFIARISRGRTIRQFLVAVLLAPSAVTIVWFSVFGGTALSMEAAGVPLSEAVQANPAVAVYSMLEVLPWAELSSFLTAVAVIIFFVSSSDSASYVVDMLTSGGDPDPPVWQRVFWATAEGLTAGTILYAGGVQALKALQAGVISLALPFCVLMLLLCYSLARALRGDPRYTQAAGEVSGSGDSRLPGGVDGSAPGSSAPESPA